MQQMKALHDLYEGENVPIQMVSISVDPENDSPEVLKNYGSKLGADFGRWAFLTGPQTEVRKIVEALVLAFGEPKNDKEGAYDILHSTKIIIVDSMGGIRGYYNSDASGIDEVFHRSQHVMKENKLK